MIGKLVLLLLCSSPSHGFLHEPLYETDVAIKRGMKPYDSPINVEAKTYMELVEKSSMFVDNTLFIVNAVLWLFPKRKKVMLVAPRKWGKSMALDMVRTFLDVHWDEFGKLIPRKQTNAYTLFHKGEIRLPDGTIERLQKPLLISSQPDIMEMFQGRIPVIYFSFKDLVGYTHEELRDGLVRMIQGIFYQHRFLPTLMREVHARTFKEERREYMDFVRKEFEITLRNESLDYVEHIHNLEYLIEFVCSFSARQPYVIIDDYDGPILNLIRSGNATPAYINVAMEVLEGFITDIVYHNEQVAAAIMCGNFVPQKPDWPFQWKSILIDGTLKNTVASDYLGFNKADVDTLLERNNVPFHECERVYKWYGNYKSNITGYHFFNPHSIAHFLKRRKFRAYVNISEDQLIINRTLQNRLEITLNLISGQTELIPEIASLGEDGFTLCKGSLPDYFYFYMFRMGFLAFHARRGTFFERRIVELTGMSGIYVTVPNNEIMSIIANWMLPIYKRKYNIDDRLLRNASIHLLHIVESESTDTSGFDEALQALYKSCSKTISIDTQDTAKPFLRFQYTDTVHPILNCVALRMQCLSAFQVHVLYNRIGGADIVARNDATNATTVIELQLNATSPQHVLNRTLQLDRQTYNMDKINQIKFIGISVSNDCVVRSVAKFEKKIIVQEESSEE